MLPLDRRGNKKAVLLFVLIPPYFMLFIARPGCLKFRMVVFPARHHTLVRTCQHPQMVVHDGYPRASPIHPGLTCLGVRINQRLEFDAVAFFRLISQRIPQRVCHKLCLNSQIVLLLLDDSCLKAHARPNNQAAHTQQYEHQVREQEAACQTVRNKSHVMMGAKEL